MMPLMTLYASLSVIVLGKSILFLVPKVSYAVYGLCEYILTLSNSLIIGLIIS